MSILIQIEQTSYPKVPVDTVRRIVYKMYFIYERASN